MDFGSSWSLWSSREWNSGGTVPNNPIVSTNQFLGTQLFSINNPNLRHTHTNHHVGCECNSSIPINGDHNILREMNLLGFLPKHNPLMEDIYINIYILIYIYIRTANTGFSKQLIDMLDVFLGSPLRTENQRIWLGSWETNVCNASFWWGDNVRHMYIYMFTHVYIYSIN